MRRSGYHLLAQVSFTVRPRFVGHSRAVVHQINGIVNREESRHHSNRCGRVALEVVEEEKEHGISRKPPEVRFDDVDVHAACHAQRVALAERLERLLITDATAQELHCLDLLDVVGVRASHGFAHEVYQLGVWRLRGDPIDDDTQVPRTGIDG
jgi:hypothetical protein